ncbi:MAG: cytochrome P450, partial [Pontixanthobacter sp.]
MATTAPPSDVAKEPEYRTSPTAYETLLKHLELHPEDTPRHTEKFDVSRSDIYAEDRWQPIFAEMRAKGDLHHVSQSPYGPYWNVVSHKAIQHVEALPELFSSSWEHGGITILERDDDPELQLPMFIAMDRPKHTGQRRTVAPAFTPREMKRMDDEIRARTGEVLDSLPQGETFDWVEKVSIELTTGMLAILFGFPWEDRQLLTYWSDWAGDTEIATVKGLTQDREKVLHEMGAYFQQLWMKRSQEEPGADLISMMIHSDAMSHMDPREFMGNLVLLIVGGNDTTRNTMSGIVHGFDKFPDQREAFEQNPDLIPNAVQECIRYQTPLAHMRRTASEDTELFG